MDKILLDINQGKYIKNFFLLYGVLAEKNITVTFFADSQ